MSNTGRKPADPLSVACPVCKRQLGEICKNPQGNGRWGRPHKTRMRAAAKEKK
jgi:hypothetical protein